MAIALVQAFSLGTASATGTTPFTVGPITASLPQTTQAGNLLVVLTAYKEHRTSGTGTTGVIMTPSISGVGAFSAPASNQWTASPDTDRGAAGVQYVANAPAVTAGTTITVTNTVSGAGISFTVTCEAFFLEFSGVKTVSPVDASRSPISPNTGVPTAGNLTTTQTDLIIAGYSGDTSNAVVGSGWTALETASAATFAVWQYKLNQAAGTINTDFSSGSQTHFGGFATSFKPQPITNLPFTFGTIIGF